MCRKGIVPIVAAMALAVPAPAAAHHHQTRRTPLSIALAHAFQLWGEKPCNGHYRVELVVLPEWATGHADWESPTGLDLYTSPPSTWTGCVMQLQRANWTPEGIAIGWAQDCTTVLHEWGHLTGHPHSDEAGASPEPPEMSREQLAVMRSGAGNYSDDIARCGLNVHSR